MNNFNNVDKYVCPPFKDNCDEPNYDPSIEFFKGMIYSAVVCFLFWIATFYLI
jgi:hypothetical protein